MASTRKIGRLTLFAAGASEERVDELAGKLLDTELRAAELAYRSGNREGLREAVSLLYQHRRSAPWPDWVQCAVADEIRSKIPDATRRRGRHADPATQRFEDTVDAVRVLMILRAPEGSSEWAACRFASKSCGGDVGGTHHVMLATLKRVRTRIRTEPDRYYPLITGLLARELGHDG